MNNKIAARFEIAIDGTLRISRSQGYDDRICVEIQGFPKSGNL